MFLLHVSSAPQLPWLLYLANVAVASLLVCGMALFAQRVWPNRTLPLRHTILLAGLLVALAVPAIVGLIDAAGFSLIEISSPVPVAAVASAPVEPTRVVAELPLARPSARANPSDPTDDQRPGQEGAVPPFPTQANNGSADHAIERALDRSAEPVSNWWYLVPASAALLLVWCVGILYEAYRFAIGLVHVRCFLRTVEPVADARLQRIARGAAQSLGLKKCPQLGQSLAIETPVSVGFVRGQVVLPARQLAEWSDEAWRALLLHEMAHLRRHDLLIGLLQRMALILYWWNPLLRRISAHIAVLREQICDDLVTQHGSQEDRYAALIVELAGRVVASRPLGPVLGAADGSPGELAGRIRRLLDPHRQLATTLNRTMKCAVVAFCLALVLGVGGTSIRWANAHEEEPAKSDKREEVAKQAVTALTDASANAPLRKQVRVVDKKDRPVVGAKVTPWAIRSATGHGPWTVTGKGHSDPPVVITGDDGIATIPFPRYVEPEEKLPALELTCRVEHPDFAVSTYNNVPVTRGELEKLTTIEVAAGAKIVVQPVAQGVTFDRDRLFALWSSPTPQFAVHVTDDDKIELPRLAAGNESLRIAYLPKEGQAMFSEVLTEKLENGQQYALTAELQPAIRVQGRLDERVPRPVKNGLVVGTVMNKANGNQSLHWRVWTRIREDGTFTLDPVPADQLQVIAICDGFMAASGSRPEFAAEKLHESFNYPQVFAVNAANQAITLKMIPTTECSIRVLDPGGQPIQGAKCETYPNVKWWDGGSQIYCHPLFSSLELLEGMPTAEISRRMMEPTRFQAVTDATGVAVVKNLPPRGEDFIVTHHKFELPIDGNRRTVHVEPSIKSPQRITVTMQPKGSQHIGDLPAALLEACATPAAKGGKPANEAATVAEDGTTVDAAGTQLHKKIRVVDEQGRPIVGATITPWAIRDALGAHGGWRPNNKGRSEPPILTTDAEGRATLPFPRYCDPAERIPPVHITCRLDHPGYVQTVYNDVHVKESELADEETLVMKPGAQVEVEALEGDKPISSADLHAIWSSPSQALKATLSSDGKLLLPRLPAGDELVRVVYLPREGDTLFSDVQSLKLSEGERYPLSVPMKPALTISGRVDDSVPRPVKNGRVVAEVIDRVGQGYTLEWRTWAEIKEDGTFTLAPIPAGELQVIALCDGFQAASGERPPNISDDRRSPGMFQLPQVFSVDAEHHDVTLKMTPTADCTVRVLDPDGKPVAGAQVGFSPNVGWWDGGAQLYCSPLSTSAEQFRPLTKEEVALRDRLLPPPVPNKMQLERPFGAITGADGVAVIRNLPAYDASFAVLHADWELPIEKQNRWGRIQLKPGPGNEITVRVQPKGKDFLGDSAKAPAPAPPPALAPATPSAPKVPSEKQVLVLDPDGKPLAGATITPSTVRANGSREWLPFASLTLEPEHPHPIVTDTEGIARVPLLPQVAEKASAINCRVEHPKYAIMRESDVRLDGSDFAKVSTIRMHRGARLTITPEAPGVTFAPAALHAMWTGREENFAVHVTDSGQIEMPPLPAGKTMYRVIYLPKNGQAMFGDTQEVELVDGEPVAATVAMHPAVRVTGKFDSSVPRPVNNGVVVAQVVDTYDSKRRLRWRIWTKVADDGSFVLEPVPRGELQVIGMSNGYTAVSTGRKAYHMRPQVFEVSGTEAEITLQMEPAAELTVRVVNEAGQPVDGAHCMALPQVNWIGGFGGENQFYCLPRYSSLDMLNGMTIHERSRLVPNPSPFSGKTDQKGIVVLKNLPPGSDEVVVSGQGMRTLRVELESGARRAVTVKFDEQRTANLGIVPTEPVQTPVPTSSSPPIEKTAASTKRIAEPAPTELAGVVVDEDGKPLADVDVDAWTWHAGNETKTDKDGRFVLKGFERNEAVEIEFTKSGYSPALFIEQQAGTPDWTVVLTQGTWLEGQVLDPGGKPAPKALIRAWRGPFRNPQVTIRQVWTETHADDQGRYRLNLEPAAYTIEVQIPGVGTLRESNVTLAAKEQKSLDLKLDRGVTFEATVRNSITGQPVEGIVLWNWQDQYSGIKGKSDNEGKLVIEGMMPGEFEFKVSAIGSDRRRSAVAGEYARWWSPQAKNEWQRDERKNKLLKRSLGIGQFQRNFDGLTFDLAGDSTAVEIFVEPAVTIAGRVLDPNGNPVAGATVAPAKTGSGNSLTGDTRFSHQTDKEGRFTMKLPASKENPFNLIAHDGEYQQWRDWANAAGENVFTNPGDKIDGVELRLTRGGTVKGRVLNAAGQPRGRVEVRAAAVDKRDNRYYVPTTRTDEYGNYELKFISPGEQHIQVEPFWLRADEAPKDSTQVVTIKPDAVVEGIDFKAD